MPLDAHVLEAVRGVARLEHVPRPTRRHNPVDLTGGQRLGDERQIHVEVVGGDIARDVNRFPVSQGQTSPRRPEIGQAHPPVDVLAQIENLPAGHPADGHGRHLADRTHRRRRRGHEPSVAVVGDRHRIPAGVVEAWLTPAGDHTPQVDRLARDQIGDVDVRPRAAPARAGPRNDGRAVGKVDADLSDEAELRTPLVVGTRQPDLAAVPPVGQDRANRVRAWTQQLAYVVGLHLQALAVLGEPGSQLGVADAPAVDERLVDPVGSGIKPRAHDCDRGHLERAAHEHRRSPPRRRPLGGLHRLDPQRRPVRRLEQPDLEHVRRGPVALPEVCPHFYLPSNARPRTQGRPRVLDEHGVGALHRAGVPAVVGADAVLNLLARAFRQPPRETRPRGADPDRVAEVFDAQPARRVRQPGGARRACRAPDQWPERTDRS